MSQLAILGSLLPLPGLVNSSIYDYLKEKCDIAAALAQAKMNPTAMGAADQYFTVDQINAFIEDVFPITSKDNPAIALHAAEMLQPIQMGLLGQLMISSRTAKEALENFVKYKDLLMPFAEVNFEAVDDTTTLTISLDIPKEFKYICVHYEMIMAGMYTFICNAVDQHFPLLTAKFPYAAPVYIKEYERIFKAPLVFNHYRAEAVFKNTILNQSLHYKNRAYYSTFLALAEKRLKEFRQRHSLAFRIIKYMEENFNGGMITVEEIAQSLNISDRTLQRKLEEENTSFLELRDQFRHQMALKWLQDTSVNNIKMDELAVRLGFSHKSSFYNSFKRLQGDTPVKYRQHYLSNLPKE